MKTTHVIGILVIAIAVAFVWTTAGDASQYLAFDEARSLADQGSKTQVHVVGQLKKDSQGNVVGIESSPDMLSFKFVMVDENGMEETVYHANPMPVDFMQSEQVVIIGSFADDKFIADKILLKCPSKYQEENIAV